ncbi:MAG TPA: M15 family metallopeptidase [Actinomycetota bacterium]|nr:M15 family metallopeptidase [Actinomycetota bacterium]
MTTAVTQPSARRTPPPIPFPVLLGGLCVLLATVIGLRWSGPEGRTGTLVRQSAAGDLQPRNAGVAPPACAYRDIATPRRDYSDWKTTLLDTAYALPRDYSPPDLVSAEHAGFSGPFLVRALVIEDLAALRAAAEAAGNPVDLAAAYRSYAQQDGLFRRRQATLGRARALEKTARPGHSEHQLGTAVDFKSRGAADVTEAWARSAEGRWIGANAHRFGFIMSYPAGRSAVSCYGYEPWHFRYFGPALAQRIHASGMTPREYLWRREQLGTAN